MTPSDCPVAVEIESKVYIHITNPAILKEKLEFADFLFNSEEVIRFGTNQQPVFYVDHQYLANQIPDLKKDETEQVVVVNF